MAKRIFRPGTIWRALVVLFVLYLSVGYVSARIHWVPALSPPASDSSPEPPLAPPGARALGVTGVHTLRSHDAVGTEVEVAWAARNAELDFVMLSDHRASDSPDSLWEVSSLYTHDVLLLRGQEVSLGGEVGRVLVFGLDTALTQWQSGPQDFASQVGRSGATAIVAHSRSPRVRDSWRPRAALGMVGWEVFDLADIGRARLADPWVAYHLLALGVSLAVGRGDESLVRLFREGFDQPAVAAFDSLFASAQITAVGALDAHPKTRIGGRLLPPYGPFFRSVVNHVELSAPLSDDPEEAAAAVLTGLRRGGVFISLGRTTAARGFVFRLSAPTVESDREVEWGADRKLRAGFPGEMRGRLIYRVIKDGVPQAWVRGGELAWPLAGPGDYRVEVYTYTSRLGPLVWNLRPWIFTNPHRVRSQRG